MPLRLLTRTERWKKGNLATRVALLSSMLAILVLLPALGMSYVALRSLLTDKVASELEVVALETRLRFEARLDTLIETVRNSAAQSIYSNALADSSERNAYVKPLLRDLCLATSEIETLFLADFEGKMLAEGCKQHAETAQWMRSDVQLAISQAALRVGVLEIESIPHLSISAPIHYLPTGSLEGGLWAQVDLTKLFLAVKTGVSAPYSLQLRHRDNGLPTAGLMGSANGDLLFLVPISLRSGSTLPLAIEIAIPRNIAYRPLQWLILGCLLIGLFAVILVTWQSRRIAKDIASPLEELEATARRVAAGDLDHLPRLHTRPGERDSFRLLAASVYRMIHTLKDTQQRLSLDLEQRTGEVRRSEADRQLKEHALDSIQSGVLIVEHSPSGSRVRYANNALLLLSERTEGDVIGAEWPALLEDDRSVTVTRRAPDAPWRITRTRSDGSTTYLELSASPVIESDRRDSHHSVIVVSDVTARHEATLALALRERAMQAASNGFIITDLQQPDNPIIYVNPAFEHITQYSAQEVIGRNCRLLRPKEYEEQAVSQLREAIAARKPCSVVLRNTRKDGSLFWNQLSISPVSDPLTGVITHYVGVQTDITDRRVAEEMMIEWLSRLDVIFTLSPDPLVCLDEHGRVSYVNAAAERVFGTTMGALNALPSAAFEARLRAQCDPDHPYPGLPTGASSITPQTDETGDDPKQDCLVHLSHPRPLILHQTYRYCGVAGTSVVVYFRDVTREAELDRMKSEFLSTAAHELRTPMASILGFSELLMMRRYDEDKTRELLGTINRQAQRLTHLLNDLLDLARIEARRAEGFRFEALPLRSAIDDTLAAFLIPDNRHRLLLHIPPTLPDIRADRAKFQQALLNILSNAFKFSPAGGDVEVRVLMTHPEGKPLIGISVRDEGIGMNEEARAHAFERFYRSDRSGNIPGTGLGLPLVLEIVKLHGGSVTLDSEPDVGTCITLWFPIMGTEVPIASSPHLPASDPQAS